MSDGLTYAKAAAIVLKDAPYPLSAKEIFREIQNRQLVYMGERSGHESLRVAINRDIKVNGLGSIFIRTQPGRFALNTDVADGYFATTHQRASSALEESDRVLVVRTSMVNRVGHFHGIRRDYTKYLKLTDQSNGPIFIDRFAAESDARYKQIVSYVIIKHGDQILEFDRSEVNETGEYVDGHRSIGFGGHVQERDYNLLTMMNNDSGYSASVRREILEEAGIDVDHANCRLEMIGILNDDSTPLGKNHFAFVHLLEVATPQFTLNPEEYGISNLQFSPLSQVSTKFHLYEYWSKLCLLKFFREHLAFTCYVQYDPDFPLGEYSDYFLAVGSIGSGKSLACRILEQEYGYVRVPCSKILFELAGLGSIGKVERSVLQDTGYAFITKADGHQRLVDGIIEYMNRHPGERYLIDGLRYPATLALLRQKLSKPITVLYVENAIDRSYEFFKTRQGESYTFQEFLRILEHPVERQVESFLPEAKIVVFNHGSMESYGEALRDFFSRELLKDPWDVNASRRHEQITGGVDLTFSRVTTPVIIDTLLRQPGHTHYSVLDVGCGTGVLTRILSEHVRHVTGVDPSTESVRIAQEHTVGLANVAFEAVAIEDFMTEEESLFDFVVAHMVLQDLANLDKALARIYSLLRDKGHFVFSIPHPCFFSERKRALFSNYRYLEPSFHEVRFTISNDRVPLPRKTPYYHRPLSSYDAALRKAGFIHERLMEPKPDTETLKLYPDTTSWDYPHVLLVVSLKDENVTDGCSLV